MKLKLPPKLISPYTLPEWLELGYDKDPKFTKTLKFLNLALRNLKATKPPTAEAFADFTEQTAYLIKRLRKMIKDPEMPEAVMAFCDPFLKLLIKWQKGAVKVQDILEEEGEESAAEAAETAKYLKKAASSAQSCIKDYTTLAQALNKALKDVLQINKLVIKGATSPKLDAIVEQIRTGKTFKSLEASQKKCETNKAALPETKSLGKLEATAQEADNKTLASQAAGVAAQLQAIDKLTKAVTDALEKYQAISTKTVQAAGARAHT